MMITCAILLSTLTFGAGPVQLQTRVATVTAIVKELADATGLRLSCSREVQNEVLFVALPPEPPDRLITLIAKADAAEWVSEDGRTILTRSKSLKRLQEQNDHEALTKTIDKARQVILVKGDAAARTLANLREAVTDAGRSAPPARTTEEIQRADARTRAWTPSGRLLSRIVRSISASDLAKVPAGHTARWASKPTQIQHQIRQDAAGLDIYLIEAKQIEDLTLATQDKDAQKRIQRTLSFFRARERNLSGPMEALVSVQHSTAGDYQFNLEVLDKDGLEIDFASCMFSAVPDDPQDRLPNASQWSGNPVVLGDAAQSIVNGLAGGAQDPAQTYAAEDTVHNEPLSLLLSAPLRQLAKAVATPMICRLPDESAFRIGQQLETAPKLVDVEEGLMSVDQFTTLDGVLVGEPRTPGISNAIKMDRQAMAGFLATMHDSRLPSLDQSSAYVLAAGDGPVISNLENVCVRAAGDQGIFLEMIGLSDVEGGYRDLYAFYALCNQNQRNTLWSGGSLEIGTFSPAAQSQLDAATFTRRGMFLSQSPMGSFWRDITCYLNSLPRTSILSAKVIAEPIVSGKTQAGNSAIFEASSLGNILVQQEHGRFLDPGLGYPLVTKSLFVPGRRGTLGLRLQALPQGEMIWSLRDYNFDPKSKPVPYTDLPAEHLAALNKSVNSSRQMDANRAKFKRQPPP